jgi:signal transduction histidine kinase
MNRTDIRSGDGNRTTGNILVVDDNLDNLGLLSRILTEKGYKVRPAPSGSLALKSVRSILPDIVLLDIKMPKMDGYEVCRRLKADERTRDVPILFISALAEVTDKIKGFNVGGVDYITKPFQYEEVLARVGTHLALRRIQSQLERQNKRLHQEIEQRKRAEDHVHTLTHELIKAQENERRKISYELHERIAQDLSCLIITCDALFDNQPHVPRELQQKIEAFSKTLKSTIEAIRDLSYDLRPPDLDLLGLAQTVSYYCRDFSKKTGLIVDFTSTGIEDIKLDFDTEINLYRLIQEGLTNIKKHADADHVTIRLVAAFPDIILRIEDNGKGFDVQNRLATLTKEKRMGIRGMVQRAKLLQGEMKIQSKPMRGTKISIRLPYKDNNSGSKENHNDNRRPFPF